MPLLVEHGVAVPLVVVKLYVPKGEEHGEHGYRDEVEEVGEQRRRDLRVEPNEDHHEQNGEGRARREGKDVEARHGVGEPVHPGATRARPHACRTGAAMANPTKSSAKNMWVSITKPVTKRTPPISENALERSQLCQEGCCGHSRDSF